MGKCTAAQREHLSPGIYKMTFRTETCAFSAPGQYALIDTDGIRRPYQVCDYDSKRFTIVFSDSDNGANSLLALSYGDEIDADTGLGNGFDVESVPDDACLVADSTGIPEMLEVARALLTRGRRFKAILGYPTRSEMFMVDSFRNICSELEVVTLDGSNGREGRASDVARGASYVCASGSRALLKALAANASDGQFSFSSAMQAASDKNGAFAVETASGLKVCMTDGPVFSRNEIRWETL